MGCVEDVSEDRRTAAAAGEAETKVQDGSGRRSRTASTAVGGSQNEALEAPEHTPDGSHHMDVPGGIAT